MATWEWKFFTIKQVTDMMQRGSLNVKPDYQRGDVHDATWKQTLISDIISCHKTLPSLLFRQLPDGRYEVADGQQRSETMNQWF